MRLLNTLVCIGLILSAGVSAAEANDPTFFEDAHGAANRWVNEHPADIAVVIRLGEETKVAPETISYWLRQDFENSGCQTHFLFERGDAGGSSVGFVSRNHAWGPFSLAGARQNVVEPCAQHRFEIERDLN